MPLHRTNRQTSDSNVGNQLQAIDLAEGPAYEFLPNVKGVARRKEDSQSEANEGRYPPLPPPSSPLDFASFGLMFRNEAAAIAHVGCSADVINESGVEGCSY